MSDEGMKQDVDGRHYNHEDREKMLTECDGSGVLSAKTA